MASDALSFRDQPLRSRCLARIADALFEVDPEQGRTLFRKAWEAAETADRDSEDNIRLRDKVLELAARRDHLLAEELLQKLKAGQKETTAENSRTNSWALAEASEKRLSLARSLLSTGEVADALRFADPVLGSVTISTMEFLTLLREQDAAAADRRYAAALVATSGNMTANANTIALLSSYIFTPHLYVTFDTAGGAEWSSAPSSYSQPVIIDPQLRLAFFQTAATILMRPLPEQDSSSSGTVGKYMVVRRLMPLFEQYAPKEITVAMRGQLEILSSLAPQDLHDTENEGLQKGLRPEKQQIADQEHSLLDQIDHAKTSAERDQLYFKLALLALKKDDLGARDYVSKIDETWFRKGAQAWVDWGLAFNAIGKKKVEVSLELSNGGQLTHIQRVWILTQSAKLLARTDPDRASSLLNEAAAEVGRIAGSDLDRPRGCLAVANALNTVEPTRVWDATYEAIRATNSSDGFTGEDGAIALSVNSAGQIAMRRDANPDFDIAGIFAKLAALDYERAVQLARGFQGEAPRANATIAISRSVLEEKGLGRRVRSSTTSE